MQLRIYIGIILSMILTIHFCLLFFLKMRTYKKKTQRINVPSEFMELAEKTKKSRYILN